MDLVLSRRIPLPQRRRPLLLLLLVVDCNLTLGDGRHVKNRLRRRHSRQRHRRIVLSKDRTNRTHRTARTQTWRVRSAEGGRDAVEFTSRREEALHDALLAARRAETARWTWQRRTGEDVGGDRTVQGGAVVEFVQCEAGGWFGGVVWRRVGRRRGDVRSGDGTLHFTVLLLDGKFGQVCESGHLENVIRN